MFGEVFICQFPFTSGTAGRIRPVPGLFDLQQDAVIYRITSASHTGAPDVALNGWQAARLLKPPVARPDRLVTAGKTVFLRRPGVLSAADLAAIRNAWNQRMML